jgi:hypothetical protein
MRLGATRTLPSSPALSLSHEQASERVQKRACRSCDPGQAICFVGTLVNTWLFADVCPRSRPGSASAEAMDFN